MDLLRTHLQLAQSVTRAAFVAGSNPLFLLKRPIHRVTSLPDRTPITFETKLAHLDVDPFAGEWRIAAVKKREGNPYPDRFSVGRAPNCDVVIRLPSVSKVHAHILVTGPATYSLRDNGSSNSTFVNHRKLEVKTAVPLQIGDLIGLGALELEFIDAERLYEILHTEVCCS